MQCGKCRSVCPVFKEMGNELYVARGKNKLAEKLVSGDLQITQRVKDAIVITSYSIHYTKLYDS